MVVERKLLLGKTLTTVILFQGASQYGKLILNLDIVTFLIDLKI